MGSLVKAPDYQPPTLKPLAVANDDPATPVQLTTAGEMLPTAEWFDLIFRGARQDNAGLVCCGPKLTGPVRVNARQINPR
jgi:hypothetical protein